MESQTQSHGDSRQDERPGFKSLNEQHKKGANPPPRRRSARLQLHSVQSHQKPAFVTKSSLSFGTFHQNALTDIIRRSSHKHFLFLMREFESQRQHLIASGTGKTLEDSDEEWQSLCPTPTTPSSHDSDSEASEDTLDSPSDTELFGLCAKSPLSPLPIPFEASSDSSLSSPPPSFSGGYRLRSGRLVGGSLIGG